MTVKLGDLGAARFSDASLSVGLVSPQYTAAERMDGRSPQKSKETDMYSMGVSVCELFTGLPPSRADRADHLIQIRQRDVRFICREMVSDDPSRRPSSEEALAAISCCQQREEYKACPPRRMVKGKIDGVDDVTLTDSMW